MKIIAWIGIALCFFLGALGVYFAMSNRPAEIQQEGYQYIDTPRYALSDFSWVVKDVPGDGYVPHQSVALSVKGKLYPAGDSVGCNPDVERQLLPGEVARLICWFAGGGDEFVVTNEEGVYRLIRRWIQETGGPEVQAEPHGPWEVVEILD